MDQSNDLTVAILVDVYAALGSLDEAYNLLNAAIDAHRRKRSPELAILHQRMAHLAAVGEDRESQLKWLSLALETDSRNFEIAVELAEIAMAANKHDLAMKALRAITMVEDSDAGLRANAFFQQAKIAYLRNDVRRAQHWARKAKSLDAGLPEIDAFLKEIGA